MTIENEYVLSVSHATLGPVYTKAELIGHRVDREPTDSPWIHNVPNLATCYVRLVFKRYVFINDSVRIPDGEDVLLTSRGNKPGRWIESHTWYHSRGTDACCLCGSTNDVKPFYTAGDYGLPVLQNRPTCGKCADQAVWDAIASRREKAIADELELAAASQDDLALREAVEQANRPLTYLEWTRAETARPVTEADKAAWALHEETLEGERKKERDAAKHLSDRRAVYQAVRDADQKRSVAMALGVTCLGYGPGECDGTCARLIPNDDEEKEADHAYPLDTQDARGYV